jgi:hypothetical protein
MVFAAPHQNLLTTKQKKLTISSVVQAGLAVRSAQTLIARTPDPFRLAAAAVAAFRTETCACRIP